MKEKRLLKALGQVDADYIEEASPTQQAKRPGWLKWGGYRSLPCSDMCCHHPFFPCSHAWRNFDNYKHRYYHWQHFGRR